MDAFSQRLAMLTPAHLSLLSRRLGQSAAKPASQPPAPSPQAGPGSGLRLVAYIEPVLGEEISTETLRAFLSERLPAYMLPASFVVLGSLPLTPHGKLDRQALPDLDLERSETGDTFTAPQTPDERAIAAVWAELLGIDLLSVHDNFFELGGHSLLVARMAVQLRDLLGFEVPVTACFQNPTIASMGRWVQAARWAASGTTRTTPGGEKGSPGDWDEIEL